MSSKKKHRKENYEQLKWETARELHLENDLEKGNQLSARDAGRIGGQMVRKLVEAGEKSLEEVRTDQEKIQP